VLSNWLPASVLRSELLLASPPAAEALPSASQGPKPAIDVVVEAVGGSNHFAFDALDPRQQRGVLRDLSFQIPQGYGFDEVIAEVGKLTNPRVKCLRPCEPQLVVGGDEGPNYWREFIRFDVRRCVRGLADDVLYQAAVAQELGRESTDEGRRLSATRERVAGRLSDQLCGDCGASADEGAGEGSLHAGECAA
jgi:hypothetical protein